MIAREADLCGERKLNMAVVNVDVVVVVNDLELYIEDEKGFVEGRSPLFERVQPIVQHNGCSRQAVMGPDVSAELRWPACR
jgi:hypothetical protein